jgi:transcriptional regulator with XRE-family HTH domain
MTNVAFTDEAGRVAELGHLTDVDIARATGAAPSTARAWLAGTRSPSGERAERLAELSALVERLACVMKPEYISVWMRKPLRLLDDDKPLDAIGAGRYREVSRLIAALESPPAS